MRSSVILLAMIVLSVTTYAGKEKKTTKRQEPVKQEQQAVVQKDTAIKGIGNSMDFGTRMYNPRLGRSLYVAPKQEQSNPYQYTTDNPVKPDK